MNEKKKNNNNKKKINEKKKYVIIKLFDTKIGDAPEPYRRMLDLQVCFLFIYLFF